MPFGLPVKTRSSVKQNYDPRTLKNGSRKPWPLLQHLVQNQGKITVCQIYILQPAAMIVEGIYMCTLEEEVEELHCGGRI